MGVSAFTVDDCLGGKHLLAGDDRDVSSLRLHVGSKALEVAFGSHAVVRHLARGACGAAGDHPIIEAELIQDGNILKDPGWISDASGHVNGMRLGRKVDRARLLPRGISGPLRLDEVHMGSASKADKMTAHIVLARIPRERPGLERERDVRGHIMGVPAQLFGDEMVVQSGVMGPWDQPAEEDDAQRKGKSLSPVKAHATHQKGQCKHHEGGQMMIDPKLKVVAADEQCIVCKVKAKGCPGE